MYLTEKLIEYRCRIEMINSKALSLQNELETISTKLNQVQNDYLNQLVFAYDFDFTIEEVFGCKSIIGTRKNPVLKDVFFTSYFTAKDFDLNGAFIFRLGPKLEIRLGPTLNPGQLSHNQTIEKLFATLQKIKE